MTFTRTRYRTLTTRLGTFIIWANGVDQVGMRTVWHHDIASSTFDPLTPVERAEVDETVTINRVEYAVNFFVTRTTKLLAEVTAKRQAWRCNPIADTSWAYDGHDTSFITRRDWMNNNTAHGTSAARERFIKDAGIRLASWLDTEAGQAFLYAGQAVDDANVVEGIDAKIAEHQEVVRQLLNIQLRLAQGKRISDVERSFARYVRIENNLGEKIR